MANSADNHSPTAEVQEEVRADAVQNADVRYSFTAQYLCSSAIFARLCASIEDSNSGVPGEETLTKHRGLATSAIFQCVAAVEAESAELTLHGPGHHLGSNAFNFEALAVLQPLAELIDEQQTLTRYKVILHLLRKPPLNEGAQPWQDMALLIRVRNELTHYKSKWGADMEREKLFKGLRALRIPKPSFVSQYANFFPHQFLGAASSAWAVRTAVLFINAVYDRLEITSPLTPHAGQFEGVMRVSTQ